jgi:ketosteroid isomerase-like protein
MKIGQPKFPAILAVVAFICLPRMVAQQSVTVGTLNQFVAAFNACNLDAVVNFFADDCELLMPRGPEPWGQRHVGKERFGKDWQRASMAFQMCIMGTLNTGFQVITASPDGR